MSNGKHRVTTLQEACNWISGHGSEIDVKWEKQDQLNETVAETFKEISIRLDRLANRIAWATGAAVMLGGVLTLIFRTLFPGGTAP